ncbi:hypothetical protein [Microseira sp. BLCC-F43]|jgi:hypothetical protein|uniref:hypothetical protein n=1 Tax=Microseira sp. BLCC-F43 TaxID=3153602 RepID=UPI0035BB2791
MLKPEGAIISRWYSVRKGVRQSQLVKYDASYVMKKFEHDFLIPLGMSMSEFANSYYAWNIEQPVDGEVLDDRVE